MKKMLKVLLVLMTVVSIAGCSSKTTTEKATKKTKTLSGNYQVEIKVKDYGTIYAEIDADTAPITVTNFVKLSKEKFYDDLTFHRIIDGFMIQGGDPKGDGTGGSKETIKGEFSDNGVKNPLSHTRGALSMARSQDNDSASSQFFIVQSDSTYLDGQYAVFGYVYEGMDIVDQICKDVKVEDNNSASSQFFIVQSDSTYLDGQYAVFGYVYEGMDIVDQICKDVKVEDNNGTVKKENQPVIESIRCKKI